MDINAIARLVEGAGTLPAIILVSLLLIYRYAPERKSETPEAQMAKALELLAQKVDANGEALADLKDQTIDRLARVETEVKNLKERR